MSSTASYCPLRKSCQSGLNCWDGHRRCDGGHTGRRRISGQRQQRDGGETHAVGGQGGGPGDQQAPEARRKRSRLSMTAQHDGATPRRLRCDISSCRPHGCSGGKALEITLVAPTKYPEVTAAGTDAAPCSTAKRSMAGPVSGPPRRISPAGRIA